jgi:hypothetical protein
MDKGGKRDGDLFIHNSISFIIVFAKINSNPT